MNPNLVERRTALARLYEQPFPSHRVGPIYNAFSYPTKIDAEAVALFVATHTRPGDTILDVFGGAGTTGIATVLCDQPTPRMIAMARDLELKPEWGPRIAHIYELSTVGALLTNVMCDPPDPDEFRSAALDLLDTVKVEHGWMYQAPSPKGESGEVRHVIWSEVVICSGCGLDTTLWDAVVSLSPAKIANVWNCRQCGRWLKVNECARSVADQIDTVTGEGLRQRERRIVQIYGRSASGTWSRPPTRSDREVLDRIDTATFVGIFPSDHIEWGDLHRSGYHLGIDRFHHLYTARNLCAMSALWNAVSSLNSDRLVDALRLLFLSYNAAHSTLLTRVVAKHGQKDLVVSGAQSGVLYVPGLPVEKNVFAGVRRKIGTFSNAFRLTAGSRSLVRVVNASSTALDLPDNAVDYVFTDPPFGDYIPYAEVNQVNEAWLGKLTDRTEEAIMSPSQGKGSKEYAQLISQIFTEVGRVLKDGGEATVVFHASKPSVWQALGEAFSAGGLAVEHTSILEKKQPSFKQVVHDGGTKDDALFLLKRHATPAGPELLEVDEAIDALVAAVTDGEEEIDLRRMYSRYVAHCIQAGSSVSISASDFYRQIAARISLKGA